MDLSPQHVQVRHSEQMRDEKKPLQTFRRLLTKLLIWKMTKREAFWHVDVKNTRLCKSVLPCLCGYLKGLSTLEKTQNLGMTQRPQIPSSNETKPSPQRSTEWRWGGRSFQGTRRHSPGSCWWSSQTSAGYRVLSIYIYKYQAEIYIKI